MRVCDICKTSNVKYEKYAVIDPLLNGQQLELCPRCYDELTKREREHRYLAYIETGKAMNGEIPRKSHWWDRFTW